MATVVNGGGDPLRPIDSKKQRASPSIFSIFKKGKKEKHNESSRSESFDDDFLVNAVAWDTADSEEDERASASHSVIGNGTMSLTRKGGRQLSALRSTKSSSPQTPTKLTPRIDPDIFQPGEHSPKHGSLSTSSASPSHAPSPLTASTSTIVSPKTYLRASDLLSPTSVNSESRDSVTPTQDWVDTSALIRHQHRLIKEVGVTTAWHLPEVDTEVETLRWEKWTDEDDESPAVGQTEGLSTANDSTIDSRQDDAPAVFEPQVMNKYKQAKQRALRSSLTGQEPGSAGDLRTQRAHGSPGRSSVHLESENSNEEFLLVRSNTVSGAFPPRKVSSTPSSPTLQERRRIASQARLRKGGALGSSATSLPANGSGYLSPPRLSTPSLSSSTSSFGSAAVSPDSYSGSHRKISAPASVHRVLERRPFEGVVRPLPSAVVSPSPRTSRSISTGQLPAGGGQIVRREGHVRVKYSRPLSQANDDTPSASRPLSRVSVPLEPYSPLSSPSPHAKFLANSVAPSCLYSPPACSPGDVWHWASSVEVREMLVLPLSRKALL